MTNERTNAELIQAVRDEDKGLGEHAMLSARIIHNTVTVMQAAYLEWKVGKGADVAMAWIENTLDDTDNIPAEGYAGAGDLTNAHDPDLYFRDNHLSGELSPYQSRMAMLIDELARRLEAVTAERDRLLAERSELERQEPVAFWWIGPGGDDNGGPYRGKPSDAAIDNDRKMGCDAQLLYSRAMLQSATVEPNVSTLTLNAADSAQSEQEGMILMPITPDEVLVAGFVGCETREEAMLGWKVAVRMQDVRTGKIKPPAQPEYDLADKQDCDEINRMTRLIATDTKMKNPNCPREPIAKCVAGFCVNEAARRERCSGEYQLDGSHENG